MRAHDPRVDRLQVVVAQAQLLGLVAAHVAEQAIGGRGQLSNTSRPFRMLEIEGQRPLVAIEGLEELAVVLAQEVRPDAARHVAAACPMLDLDHLGAHVGQMARAVRPRPVLLDRENAQAFEGKLHPVPSVPLSDRLVAFYAHQRVGSTDRAQGANPTAETDGITATDDPPV